MANVPPAKVVELTEKARLGLRSLERKMTPASLALLDFVSELWSFQIVFVLAKLKIVDALKEGARDSGAVARDLGLDADHVYRLLRAATNIDLVQEGPNKTFSLKPVGRALCEQENESFRDFIVLMGEVGWRFWGRLDDAVHEGKSAIEIETGKKSFEFFIGDENARHLFNRGMTAVSAVSADAFVAAYDLSGFKKIVDVGGGHGRLLSAMLKAAPHASGVLFDLPEVVEGAQSVLDSYGVGNRATIEGGSFFERVPEGGDLYVMKSIIHDWQDAEASKILGSIRRAAGAGSKLALYETVVPGPNQKHFSKFLDIEMIVHAGGRERTREEYSSLLGKAGFRLTRVIPTAGPVSVVEAEPA